MHWRITTKPACCICTAAATTLAPICLHGGVDLARCGYLDDVVVCSAGKDLSALR